MNIIEYDLVQVDEKLRMVYEHKTMTAGLFNR